MTPTLLNNRYRVLQNLGAGGFGNTFLAEDTYMPSARRCVIKQLKPVTNDPKTYKIVQERFQREAAVLEDVGEASNQIPDLYAYFSEAGQFYLVQEYIEGDTLTKKVEKAGPLSDNEVKQILVSLLPVLDYVHNRRIVHRDIKPDNVIIRKRDGLPVLIDFGAVKEAMNTGDNDPGNSAPSIVIGTSGFMPAEQAGGRPTFASDLYALGLTAVFLLTGKVPQDLPTDTRTGEIMWSQYARNINPNLANVIDRAIRFNVRDRFATASEMLNALQSADAADAPSNMATQVVSPGGVPHQGNNPTPPIKNPSPPQTVPPGRSPVVQPADENRPFIIGALIVGGVLLAGLALSAVLRRSPEPSSPVSSSDPRKEQQTAQQPSSPTPSNSPSGPSDSPPTTEPSPSRTPSSSRSQSSNSQPTTEPSTREQPSSSTTSRSTSRSQPSGNTPSPVVPDSSSRRSPQSPSSARDRSLPPQPIPVPPPEAENNNQNSNQSKKIPGFAPGTQQSYVTQELGKPTKKSSGYWKTRALLYENVVPGKVDLGYLYDPSSGRIRQTEASFSDSVESKTMLTTLSQMLNGNASTDIKQGLDAVYRGQSNRYQFVSGRNGSLKGVIERNEPGRIYVAVWEADLH